MKPTITSAAVTPVWNISALTRQHAHELVRHHRQRRHDEGRDAEQPRPPLPCGEEHDQHGEAEAPLPRAMAGFEPFMPAPGCSAGVWPMSSRSISRATYWLTLGVLPPRDRVVALRQLDRDLVDDAAGAAAHHQHAVGQRDGLEQIVGDQQRGLAGALERLRQFALQRRCGSARRPRRTARRAAAPIGSTASVRASATRWRMPPDS